ncbi:MAG: endonuclease/exonuclease/phosphatase family protein [Candidatus Nanopelagicales bacterium]
MRVATFNLLHGMTLRGRDPEQFADDLEDAPNPGGGGAAADPAAKAASRAVAPEEIDAAAFSATVAELAALAPDILALQEVDRHQPRSGGIDQTAVIAKAIGAKTWRFAPALHGTPGPTSQGVSWEAASSEDDPPEHLGDPPEIADLGPLYGVSLISRWPVRQWKVLRFPPAPVSLPLLAPNAGKPRAVVVPDEPRAAIAAVVELPWVDLTVVAAHLSFVPGYNTKQLQSLKPLAAGLPRPLILLGDFNLPGTIPGMLTGWRQVARTHTYPATRPRVQFDHILADGWLDEHLTHAQDTVKAVPLPVSDHCLLMADFPQP